MKALVKTEKGVGNLKILDVADPQIGENEILIEVKTCGICGTDLHIYHDQFPYWPPVILGHEFVGIIAQVGKAVEGWEIGDRVVGEPHTLACGKCYLCRTGNPQICPDKRSPGWGIDGGFAKYMRWPNPHLLHRIPDILSFETASLVEPLANVVSDVVLTNSVMPGDIVAVAGPGPIGIMAALLAKYMGASQVIMLGTNDDEELRLSLCRNLSQIDFVINVQKENVSEFIATLTSNRGVDTFIEASGAPAAIRMAAKIIRKMGVVTAIGLTGKATIEFPYDELMKKAVNFSFNISTKYDSWARAIDLLAKEILPFEKIITHKTGIYEWEKVFSDLESRKGIKGIFIL